MKHKEIRAADLHEKWIREDPEYARAYAALENDPAYTLDVVRGERRVDPNEPKVWRERSPSRDA